MLRDQYGDFAIPLDDLNTPTARSTQRWAELRRLTVQSHGIPSAILVPSLAHAAQPGKCINPEDLADETRTVSDEPIRTSGAPPLKQFFYHLRPPATVIWLAPSAAPDPQEPAIPPY